MSDIKKNDFLSNFPVLGQTPDQKKGLSAGANSFTPGGATGAPQNASQPAPAFQSFQPTPAPADNAGALKSTAPSFNPSASQAFTPSASTISAPAFNPSANAPQTRAPMYPPTTGGFVPTQGIPQPSGPPMNAGAFVPPHQQQNQWNAPPSQQNYGGHQQQHGYNQQPRYNQGGRPTYNPNHNNTYAPSQNIPMAQQQFGQPAPHQQFNNNQGGFQPRQQQPPMYAPTTNFQAPPAQAPQPKPATFSVTSSAFTVGAAAFTPSSAPAPSAPTQAASFVPSPAPAAFTYERPAGQAKIADNNAYQVKNSVTETHDLPKFAAFTPTLKTTAAAFSPSAPAFTPSFAAPVTTPAPVAAKPTPAPVAKPAPVPVVKRAPSPPKKEPVVLKLEAIAKASDDDKAVKGQALIEVFNQLKKDVTKDKKFSSDLLRKFVSLVAPAKEVEDRPSNILQLVLTRPEGTAKPLPRKKDYQDRGNRGGYRGRGGQGGNRDGFSAGSHVNRTRDGYNQGYRGDRRQEGESGGFGGKEWRKEDDEFVTKLRETARKNQDAARVENDTVKTVRLWLNLISPDNYKKKSGELRSLLFGNRKMRGEEGFEQADPSEFQIDEEIQKIVVQTIFRKAQTEHAYGGFYANLCSDIIRMELEIKGHEAKKSNIRYCEFRKQLLQFCRESFMQFFEDPTKGKEEVKDEEETLEAEMKKKHKLFGNIEFVGELYMRQIVSDTILSQVFDQLLGLQKPSAAVNDNTIEAAIKLITKLGPALEERITNIKDVEKRKKDQDNLNSIFNRFTELQTKEDEDNRASTRVKFLIQNMHQNRDSGWKKTKETKSDIKTKKEIQDEVLKKADDARRAQMQQSRDSYQDDYKGGNRYNEDSRRGNDRDRRGGRGDRQGGQNSYVQKQNSAGSDSKGRGKGRYNEDDRNDRKGNRNDRGGYNNRREEKPRREITEEDLGKQVVIFFSTYFDEKLEEEEPEEGKPLSGEGKVTKDFKLINDLKDNTTLNGKSTQGDDILFHFLTRVCDQHLDKLEKHLPVFIKDVVEAKVFTAKSYQFGLSRFLQAINDLAMDAPRIPQIFAEHILIPLVNNKRVELKDLVWWTEEEAKDEYTMVDAFYKIGALLIKEKLNAKVTVADARAQFEASVGAVFKQFKTKLDETAINNILNDLADINVSKDSDIVKILDLVQ